MMKTCVFAGTFDPITVGHKDVIDACCKKYQKVLVVIGQNPLKTSLFTEMERFLITKECFKNNPKIEVVLYSDYSNCYAEFLKEKGADVYVRGIRNQTDLEFEKSMEQKNKLIYPWITTKYLTCREEFKNVSSSLIREKLKNGQSLNGLVPNECLDIITKILNEKKA